jgi:ketosteroid isomerase-like protein
MTDVRDRRRMSTHTTTTTTTFDFAGMRDALHAWDVDALMAYYADDVEFRQIDHTSPPGSPQIVRGRAALEEMFRRVAESGIETRIVDVIEGDGRYALAVACRQPTGGRIYDHTFIDVSDGLVVRQAAVAAWDS